MTKPVKKIGSGKTVSTGTKASASRRGDRNDETNTSKTTVSKNTTSDRENVPLKHDLKPSKPSIPKQAKTNQAKTKQAKTEQAKTKPAAPDPRATLAAAARISIGNDADADDVASSPTAPDKAPGAKRNANGAYANGRGPGPYAHANGAAKPRKDSGET